MSMSGSRTVSGRARVVTALATAVVLSGLAASPATAQETPQAGVAAAVVSPAEVSGKPRTERLPVRSGMEMFLQDQITTGPGARLQILLLDQTTFTVGPQSEVTIDRFVYDPETGTGEVAAEVTKGIMRYVSGSVGKNNPENVTLETPAATLGIRGTALFVAAVPDRPDTYFAGLIGPGIGNNALARPGGFTMRNEHGVTVVRRSGFGAYVTQGEAPQDAIRIPESLQVRLHQSLRPSSRDTGDSAPQRAGTGQAPTTAAGQDVAESRELAQRQQRVDADTRAAIESASAATTQSRSRPEVPDDLQPSPTDPNLGIDVPFFAQLQWDNVVDMDLHATGPNPSESGRYHVYFANDIGPIGDSGTPVAELDQDETSGTGGSEVITINDLVDGGPTRISAFNFGAPAGSTELAEQSNAIVSLLRNGSISRGPGGSVVVDGSLIAEVAAPESGAGNTFVAFEIAPNGQITEVRELRDFSGSADVQ